VRVLPEMPGDRTRLGGVTDDSGTRPAVLPDDFVATGSEREVLAGFLELYRGILVTKLAALSDGEARRSLVPSSTTLLGLVKHLTLVEREWFGQVLGRLPVGEVPSGGWDLDAEDTVESVLADYRQACEESRSALGGHDLEEVVPHAGLGAVSVRWICVHMIEETARHVGHADILREQTDGATGFL
jgi:uncharacterized damage-inducible protein DinB